jgi:hypothetical protein
MEIDIKTAAKTFNVSRPTIYKKFNNGELSRLGNGKIDVAEMVRVFGEPSTRKKEVPINNVSSLQEKLHEETEGLLREKVRFLEEQLREARNREDWLKGKVDELTDTVKLLQAPNYNEKKRGLISRLFG